MSFFAALIDHAILRSLADDVILSTAKNLCGE